MPERKFLESHITSPRPDIRGMFTRLLATKSTDGALSSRSPNYKFKAMQWRPFSERDEYAPWIRADSHCSIEDTWTSRPQLLSEDAARERKEALELANNIYRQGLRDPARANDLYLCSHLDCERSLPGQGISSREEFVPHLEVHNRTYKSLLCADDRCSYNAVVAGTKKLEHREAQHKTGKFLCRACFLPFTQARHAHAHEREDCMSEKSDAYRHDKKRTLQCPESRCGKVFDDRAILNKHNKGTHGTGSKECEICGMKYHRGYVHPGLTTGDDETCPGLCRRQEG